MKITFETTFAQVERAQRLAHERAIARAVAQANAARELLARAEAQPGETKHHSDFWRRAVEFAEDEEALARKRLARFERRNRDAARLAFEFTRALSGTTDKHLAQMQRQSERLTPEATA